MNIEYPENPGKKGKLVATGRKLVEQIPWIGKAIEVFGPLLPDHIEDDEQRWKMEVTDKLNLLAELHRRPQISRDSLAWLFALLAAKIDVEGTGDEFICHEEWEDRFSAWSNGDIEEALAELIHADWIAVQDDMNSNSGIGGFHGKPLLFAHTHPWVHQLYPSDDARSIAEFVLGDSNEDAVSAVQISDHFGWERKRFYPALAFFMTEVVPNAMMERIHHPEYPFYWLYLNGETRRALRAFLAFDSREV